MMEHKRGGKSVATEMRLREMFQRIKEAKEPTGPTDFARRAEIDRSTLRNYPELRKEISAYGKETQPKISCRGSGANVTKTIKQDIDHRVRREHTRWARELPETQRELEEAQEEVRKQREEINRLREQRQLMARAVEHLLMIAKDAGASPRQLEAVRKKLPSEIGIVVWRTKVA